MKRIINVAVVCVVAVMLGVPSPLHAIPTDDFVTNTNSTNLYVTQVKVTGLRNVEVNFSLSLGGPTTNWCNISHPLLLIDAGLPARDDLRSLLLSAMLAGKKVNVAYELISTSCYIKRVTVKP